MQRCAGLLLHPTSLPSRFGLGDLGPAAETFLDWAQAAGQSLWQVLPLGPPDGMNSPYNALSAFAGNPLLISPQRLVEDGLLEAEDLQPAFQEDGQGASEREANRIDFAAAGAWKERLLRKAFEAFRRGGLQDPLEEELEAFRGAADQATWLEDWCLFAALHERFEGQPWWLWPTDLALWDHPAVERAREQERSEIDFHRFVQFLFCRQWKRLRHSAAERGIRLLGDLPIYVSGHSADVWVHRELFDLEPDGSPGAMAGVPPDDFSDDGQLWGNPLYRWDRMAEDGFRWWCDRLGASLRQADLVRLDHFRGFVAYWRVPAGAMTAREGQWVEGPGGALFDAFRQRFGELPLVAEDLGVITDEVRQLRRGLQLPGMRVLQFGFDFPDSEHAPHQVGTDVLVYTGTHDNDTSLGWFSDLNPELQKRILALLSHQPSAAAPYLPRSPASEGDSASRQSVTLPARQKSPSSLDRPASSVPRDEFGEKEGLATPGEGESSSQEGDFSWGLIRVAYETPAVAAMVPVQDVLGLGSEGRMNVPGTASGNWSWGLRDGALTPPAARRLRELVGRTDRLPKGFETEDIYREE